jgi:hypothetical protein
MAGRILTDFWSPAQDDDGLADGGGSMTFRQTDTTTLLDVYTDSTLATAHPNPLVSDDAGRFPQIWAPDAAVYDITCKLGTGVTVAVLYKVGAVPNGGVSASARLDAYVIPVADLTSSIAVDLTTPRQSIRMPFAWTLTGVRGFLYTAQTSGTVFTVNVKCNGVTVFSTLLTFDNAELTTRTAGTPCVISTTAIPDDAKIDVFVTQIGDGTARGLGVSLIGYPTIT